MRKRKTAGLRVGVLAAGVALVGLFSANAALAHRSHHSAKIHAAAAHTSNAPACAVAVPAGTAPPPGSGHAVQVTSGGPNPPAPAC